MSGRAPWIPEDEVETFVGSVTLMRARSYVTPARIHDLVYDDVRSTLTARVSGSGMERYRTVVTLSAPDTLGRARPLTAMCTCPVRMRCKHSAAVMLLAGETLSGRSDVPEWRRRSEEAVRAVVDALDVPEAPRADLGLQLTLVPDENRRGDSVVELAPGLANRLQARIVERTRNGRWRSAGMDWERVRYGHGLRGAQRTWFVTLVQVTASTRPARAWLDLCDAEVPTLLPLLLTAGELGIELVPGDGIEEIRVVGPRDVGFVAWRPTGRGLVLTTAATDPDGEPRDPAPGALVGTTGDLVAELRDGVLELGPVPRLPQGGARALREWRPLSVPDDAVAEFCAEFLPDLLDRVPLDDRTGALELPELVGVGLELTVRTYDGPDAESVDLLLSWSRVETFRGPDGGTTERRRPLGEVIDDDEVEIVHRVDDAGWAWILGPGTGRLSGMDAAVLLADGVADLRAVEGVEVVVDGRVREIRRAEEGPRIHVTASDDDPGVDWLGLRVSVSVDGRTVPFATLFQAVVAGHGEMLTDDGVLVPVDLERFGELRALLDEAVAASGGSRGQKGDGADGVRLRPEQAGLWSDLAEFADDLVVPPGRLRALMELAADEPAPVTAPAALHAELRPYQQHGLDWLAMLWRHGIGGILADDMGLGKTVQALALVAHVHETAMADGGPRPGPFLVVAPSSVVPNWEAEARRFVPSLRVCRRGKTESKSETTVAADAAGNDLVVTSATVLRLDAEAYAAVDWAGVILDEAQQAKNPASKLFAALAGLRAPFLLAVTGTPMENHLTELWAVAALACRGVLPDGKDFRALYRTPIEKHGDAAALARLRRRLRPFLLRRRKELVASELPPRTDAVVEVELSASHRRVYERELNRQRALLLALLDDFESNRISILAGLTVLRRLCLDPGVVDPAHASIGSAKTDELLSALTEIVDEGHRALVFSQFTTYLDTVVDRLRGAGIEVAHLDGSTTDRAGAVAEFTEGGAQVFCLSLKAGGVGLNLVGADYVFLLDPWWNPATEAQAVDRAHRIGQTRPVLVYRLVARDTIEERVVELQRRKAELFSSVLDDGEHFASALTADDLRGLLD